MPKGHDPEDLLEEMGENAPEGGESNAQVAVRGSGRTVKEALSKAGLKGEAKSMGAKFASLLRDPKNKILATRIAPKTFRTPDGKTYDCEDSVELPPPMTIDDVTQFLKNEFGGKQWNLRVMDEDGEILDAKNITVTGDPIIKKDSAMDGFQMPGDDAFRVNVPDEMEPDEEDPLDREIRAKQKQSKILELERMNQQYRQQIDELKGNGNGKKDHSSDDAFQRTVKDLEEKHQRELADMRSEKEKDAMERRLSEKMNSEIGSLRDLIAKKTTDDTGGMSAFKELSGKLDNLQVRFQSDLKDTLGSYKEAVNHQIMSLKDNFQAQITALTSNITQFTSRPADNPMKDVVPLITSSIQQSTQGYKDVIGPMMTAIMQKSEAESAPPPNQLKDTIELLQLTGAIPSGGPKDFSSRVMDFAEKMAPDVLNFVKEERHKATELTREAVQNQLKLIAQKISREVSEHAGRTIQQIAAQRGLPYNPPPQSAPVQQVQQVPQQVQQVQQVPQQIQVAVGPQPTQAPVQTAPQNVPQQRPISPPVHRMTHEEEAVEGNPDDDGGEPMTPEEEMAERVNATLEILEREMKIRPRALTWTRFAWDNLPASVLDQVIFSNDDIDVYNAVKPFADEALANRIWEDIKVKATSKEFIVAGINQIKAWALQIQEAQRSAQAQVQAQASAPVQG